jgi:hypothetical protein
MENDAFNNSSIVACVFVAVGTCLPSCCLAVIRGIYIQTHKESRLIAEELFEAVFSLQYSSRLCMEGISVL